MTAVALRDSAFHTVPAIGDSAPPTLPQRFDFQLPDALVAHEPPEARGLTRGGVRLMVSRMDSDTLAHTGFRHLPDFLRRGDVVVINTSRTINAAFEARREANDGTISEVMLHLSTRLFGKGEPWVVELRRRTAEGTTPLLDAEADEIIRLPAGGCARLVSPYTPGRTAPPSGRTRLWIAELWLPEGALSFAEDHGSAIRYSYVPRSWPLEYYQTVFADEPGSVEMPSAGRPFTKELIDQLGQKGVRIAPLVLHTGVSSLESDESPYPERYHIAYPTALAVNAARRLGGRVIAVGTTVVRALETAVDDDGYVRAGGGWTDLVITPERRLRAVDGMLTGLHAPGASHLAMLEALAGRQHIARAYEALLEHRYLWHEFGDMHLILP
ncbi:MAG TPA: S-adenosylmethionine:tRNA ribosyltransferase-isomerase [Gemmatimonadaceae bacterium]|nr:S-adenosylmethionine:tRNA ribosyltransferase-isomerase [Gemmatimonadaceae bacterium]